MASPTDPVTLRAIRRREMECAVCLNRLRQPRTLWCLHNFCQSCLEPLAQDQKIACPVCKKETTVGSGGVGDLPKNTTLINIIETLCENCLGKNRELCCDHCGLWFCAQCHENCKQQQTLTDKGNDLLKELIERKKQLTDKMTSLTKNVESVKNEIDTRVRDMMNTIQLSAECLKDKLVQEQKRQSDVLEKCSKTVADLEKTILETINENNMKDEDFTEKRVDDLTGKWSNTLINCSSDISRTCKLIDFNPAKLMPSLGKLAMKPNYENAQIESRSIGRKGSDSGQFISPTCIEISPVTKDVVILDSESNRVQLLNERLEFISSFGSKGDGEGQFKINGYFGGLAVTDDGLIVVADTGNHRLQVFTKNGTFIRSIGSKGTAAGQFNFPMGVAVHDNLIYVCDQANYRIQVLGLSGKFTRNIGSLDLFYPSAPMDITVGHNEEVIVVAAHPENPNDGRLLVFSAEGEHQATLCEGDKNSVKLHKPLGVTTDNSGHIIVSDYHSHKVHILASSGRLLRTLCSEECGLVRLCGPTGLAFLEDGDLAVVDSRNNRIQFFSFK